MSDENRKIRYAVVGAGNIAQVAVLPAFAHAKENSELVAVVSGDRKKRAALRKDYEFELDGDYAELESIPRTRTYRCRLHRHPQFGAQGLHASRRGTRSSRALRKAARPDCGRLSRHGGGLRAERGQAHGRLPLAFRGGHARGDGNRAFRKLGQVKLFSSFFTHVVRGGDIRREPEVAGGATYDLGVYCINAARHLFDAEPTLALANAIEKDGVDDTLSAILHFPGERLAQFCVSNSVAGVSSYRIAGTDGDLRVEPGYEYVNAIVHHLTIDEETNTRNSRGRSVRSGASLLLRLHSRGPRAGTVG